MLVAARNTMSDAISIGTVPTGTRILRRATLGDLLNDPSLVALVQMPDGQER